MNDYGVELVIIGAGGAGLAAALAAAEKGCGDILVLEKRDRPGGNTALAGGLFACESPVQIRQRIDADGDRLFKKAMDWSHGRGIEPRILRAFLNKSGDTIRWLEDKGLEFDLLQFYPGQEPPVQHNPRGQGARLIQVLARECQDRGVRLWLNSEAKKIKRERRGKVSGVLVVKDGEEIDVKAGSVIIATGGFNGNEKLRKIYFPPSFQGLSLSGLPLTGDGITMAEGAGAAIAEFATAIKEGPRYDLYTWPLMAIERDPVTVWVNKRGERFTDESTGYHVFESVNTMLQQPGQTSYTLLDEGIRWGLEDKGLMLRRPGRKSAETNKGPGLQNALKAEAEKGGVKIAGSWEEIAAWIGGDPEVLKNTIAEYNQSCDRGHDEVFGKERRYLRPLREAPYYAIRGLAVLLDTIGGIRINERMEVLDREGNSIPGLYAAGVTTSGWESEIYCSELSASAFGFAINSGRIAGENAAGTITGRK
jgi:fumarate reductase flavoprotein subunit